MTEYEGQVVPDEQILVSPLGSIVSSVASVGIKYGIFLFPDTIEETNELCCRQVGYGTLCCVKRLCTISHRGEKAVLRPGMVTVAKSTTSVFLEPSTHHTNVTTDVIQEWSRTKRTLAEWVEIMAVTNATNAHEVYTRSDLGAAKIFAKYAKEYKSPKQTR
jgi:hypothetical protein